MTLRMEDGDRKRLKLLMTAMNEALEHNKLLDALAELAPLLTEDDELQAAGAFVGAASAFAAARKALLDVVAQPHVTKLRQKLQS
jgi:hypothetical protein